MAGAHWGNLCAKNKKHKNKNVPRVGAQQQQNKSSLLLGRFIVFLIPTDKACTSINYESMLK